VREVQERGAGSPLTAADRPADDTPDDAPADRPAADGHGSLIAVVGVAVFVVDQLTKWWAVETLPGDPIELFWTLRLRLTFNTGLAFSLGGGRGGLVALVVAAVVVGMVWFSRSISTRLGAVALGLVLGGAFGNLSDRIFRADDGPLSGAVVDFIDLQWWPVFNVADTAITIGAVLLVVASLLESRAAAPSEP
jgi:signal peptidase II